MTSSTRAEPVRPGVLITGASGYVAGALMRALPAPTYRVVGTVRQQPQASPDLVEVRDIGPDTEWETALAGIDTVVHLAARVHRREGTGPDELAAHRRTNRDGTARLAEAAERAGVSAFIFLSTIAVIGERSDAPVTEAAPCAPTTPYGISKLEAERIVLGSSRMRVVVLRAPMVYGANAPGNFGRLVRAVRSGLPLPFKAVDNRRSFVAVENLVAALIGSVERAGMRGIYHVADDRGISTPQLITTIAEALGRPARLIAVPRWVLRPALRAAGGESLVHKLLDSLPVDAGRLLDAGWQPRPMRDALHACLS